MKGGPKAAISVGPLPLHLLPEDRAGRALAFIERYVRVPRGVGAREPLRLRPWQVDLVRQVLAPGVRQAVVSIPRGNGKSSIAAALGVAHLFAGPEGAEVAIVATDQRQAGQVLGMARRMIELDPRLARRVQVYSDRIVEPRRDATLTALPADPSALLGWQSSLVVVDELAAVDRRVWEAVTSGAGKRPESLTLAISTPPDAPDSVMADLLDYGRANPSDGSFVLREWAAPDGCAVDDEAAWAIGNPALGDFLAVDGMRAVRRTLREPTFRRLRLGQTVRDESAWLPWGAWAACADATRVVADRERVVLAFDGSASGDSTALVGCTVGESPHVFLVGLWANPGDPRWRVPRGDVDRAVDVAFDRYDVVELAADPWGWRSEIQAWADRHGEAKVIEWNTAAAQRMAPATDRLYQAVTAQTITHDGDARLAAHIAHCVAKATPMGDLVSKDKRGSPRKVDAAVAAIVAVDRAAHHSKTKPRRRIVTFR